MKTKTCLLLFSLILSASIFSQPAKKFVPWAVLQQNGQFFCPLCGEPYTPRDYGKIASKLSLSEWHANNLDSLYFETAIANISDQELVSSFANARQGNTIAQVLDHRKSSVDVGRFYNFSLAEEKLFIPLAEYRQLLSSDTSRRNLLLQKAGEVLAYRIPYGTRTFTFKDKIDFDYAFGESAKYGFHYWGWANYVLSAFMVTGDDRYAEFFNKAFKDWYAQRNHIHNSLVQFDVVWYELGIGIRLPVLIDAFRLFQHSSGLEQTTRVQMLKTFLGSGRWLAAALSRNPYHPCNWPVYSAMGLAYLAVCFPEFEESAGWLAIAKKVMDDHFTYDLYNDGGYVERTPGYSMGVYNSFEKFVSIFRYFQSDNSFYQSRRPLLENMISFFHYTVSPLGTCCPFNDSFRFSFINTFTAAAEAYNRPEWVTGLPTKCSINLEQSKFAVMRSDWSKEAMMMILNYGPAANHHHEDILDFEMYAYGTPLALDAGIGAKAYDDEFHKTWYRKAKAHNMVTINDSSLDRGRAEGEDVRWVSLKQVDYFAATHQGYFAEFGIAHRRHVVFIKERYWVIFDQLSDGKKVDHWDWLFHSPLTLVNEGSGCRSKETPGVLLLPAAATIRKFKDEGPADLNDLPGEKIRHRPINYISFQSPGSCRELGVLAFPFKEQPTGIAFKKIERTDLVREFVVQRSSDQDRIYFSKGKKQRLNADLITDARLVVLQYEKNKIKRICLIDATTGWLQGQSIWNSAVRGDFEKEY